jgi:aerobic carbon-monoxide dehydrogenase medium subunit
MKPPPFRYYDPSTMAEAVQLKAEHGFDATVLAGGQSLVPLLNLRLAHPDVLLDINRIADLQGLRRTDHVLEFGATVRQYQLEEDDAVRQALPILAEAARFIGHRELRHRGTVGGSLAHSDPAAELPCLALALSAEMVAASAAGTRTIPAAEFFEGFFTNTLQADEILTAVRFPVPTTGTGWGFAEVARRHGDFALAAAAALLRLDGRRVVDASVCLAGVADRPVRAEEVEGALAGSEPDEGELGAAARHAERLVTTPDDVHATTVYRRKVAVVATERALAAALTRAREGER